MEENKNYDFYFASGWFSPEQVANYDLLVPKLKEAGLTLFEPRYKAGELESGPLTLDRAKKIFKADLDGIDACDGMFADITFRDTGVLFEIGYACAKGIPIVLFDNSKGKPFNVMLAGTAKSCLRTEKDIENWLSGDVVYNLKETELQ